MFTCADRTNDFSNSTAVTDAVRARTIVLTRMPAFPAIARDEPTLGAPRSGIVTGLVPLIAPALRDWETRVTGKGDVPCGAHAAEVGGTPPCLVELRVPAGSAEPRLCA